MTGQTQIIARETQGAHGQTGGEKRHRMIPSHRLRQNRIGHNQGFGLGARGAFQDSLEHAGGLGDGRALPRFEPESCMRGQMIGQDTGQMFGAGLARHRAAPLQIERPCRSGMIARAQQMDRIAQIRCRFHPPCKACTGSGRTKGQTFTQQAVGGRGIGDHSMQFRKCCT